MMAQFFPFPSEGGKRPDVLVFRTWTVCFTVPPFLAWLLFPDDKKSAPPVSKMQEALDANSPYFFVQIRELVRATLPCGREEFYASSAFPSGS